MSAKNGQLCVRNILFHDDIRVLITIHLKMKEGVHYDQSKCR